MKNETIQNPTVDLFLDIVPPKATAQQQKTAVIGGRIRKYDPANVKSAKRDLLTLLLSDPQRPQTPLVGPLRVDVAWTYPWRKATPQKAKKSGWAPIPTRPDIDNLCKSFFDTLTKAGYWLDDSQVCDLRFIKGEGDLHGVRLRIKPFANA